MKKTESKNLDQNKPIQVRLNPKDGLSSKEQNPKTDPEKIQEVGEPSDEWGIPCEISGNPPSEDNLIENAKIVPKMDEIIKNNDKFETVKVLMEILCKELEVPVDSGFPTIAAALNRVWEAYFKSMEDWKQISKQSKPK